VRYLYGFLFGKLSGEMTPLKTVNEMGESNVREIICVGGKWIHLTECCTRDGFLYQNVEPLGSVNIGII
jgi:hypothetical protein